MDISDTILFGLFFWASGIFLFQCFLFIVAIWKKNNGIADIGWGLGFIIIAAEASTFHLSHGLGFASCLSSFKPQYEDWDFYLILLLVTIWGLRLSIYLFIRNWSKPEDWRYAKWRKDWGDRFLIRSFLQVFMLQGFFMLVIGSPIIFSCIDSRVEVSSYSLLQCSLISMGFVIWLIGFFFQAAGDYQLFVFKKDPANKGRVMRYGLWQYTRHPNYFGEAGMWWGIFLISCVSARDLTGGLLRVISPLMITFLLLRVSGVTMLEDKYKGNEEYEDYQKKTSSFLPLPFRKSDNTFNPQKR